MQKQLQPLKLWLSVLMIVTSLSSYSQKELTHTATPKSKVKAIVAPLKAGDTGTPVKNH
jgi:hypothetical protein